MNQRHQGGIITPHQSQVGISVGNASGANYVGAGAFMTPGQAAMPGALQQLARGMDKLGGAVNDMMLERQRRQNDTDLLALHNRVKDNYRAFDADFKKNNKGISARDAEAAYGAFFDKEYQEAKKEWGGNPNLMQRVDMMFSPLRQAGLDNASAYSIREEAEYEKQELTKGEMDLMADAANPFMSLKDKTDALNGFKETMRMMARGRNIDPELAAIDQRFAMEHMKALVAVNKFGAAQNFVKNNMAIFGDKANDALITVNNMAEAAQMKAEAAQRREAAALLSQVDNEVHYAAEKGDFSHLQDMRQKLLHLGQTEEAAKVGKIIEVYEIAKVGMDAVRELPFAEQQEAAEKMFSDIYRRDNAALVDKVKGASMSALNREQQQFIKDPAAYAAGVLQNAGQQNEKETPEQTARKNMAVQKHLAQGIYGFKPRVFSSAQVNSIKNDLADAAKDPLEKLDMLKDMRFVYGDLSHQAFTEAEVPAGAIAATSLYIDRPESQIFARDLVSISLLKDSDIPDNPNMTSGEARQMATDNEAVAFQNRMAQVTRHPMNILAATGLEKAATRMALFGRGDDLKEFDKAYDYISTDEALLRIPRNIDTAGIGRNLKWFRHNIRDFLPEGYDDEQVRKIQQNGIWISMGDKIGLVVDGIMARGRDGKILAIGLREMKAARLQPDWLFTEHADIGD